MVGDKQIEHIEVGTLAAIQLGHPAIDHPQAWLRIERAIGHDQANLGPRLDKRFAIDIALCKNFEAAGMLGHGTIPLQNQRQAAIANRQIARSL
jgi:hypothetical protein